MSKNPRIFPGMRVEWNYRGPFQHLGNDGKGGTDSVPCRVVREYSPESWSPQGRAWYVQIVGGERDGYEFVALESMLTVTAMPTINGSTDENEDEPGDIEKGGSLT